MLIKDLRQIARNRRKAMANASVLVPFWPQLRYSHGVPMFRMKEAAELLGVSYDTMRRWAEAARTRR